MANDKIVGSGARVRSHRCAQGGDWAARRLLEEDSSWVDGGNKFSATLRRRLQAANNTNIGTMFSLTCEWDWMGMGIVMGISCFSVHDVDEFAHKNVHVLYTQFANYCVKFASQICNNLKLFKKCKYKIRDL